MRALGSGLEELGFVAVCGHGIPLELLAEAYAAAREAFALPDAVKARYESVESGRQRGYTPFGKEHAKDTAIADLKEFWQVGPVLGPAHPAIVAGRMHPNRYPAEAPRFRVAFDAWFTRAHGLALELLEALGEFLEQPAGFFRDMATEGNSVVRVIHYPPVGPDAPEGAVRAAQHEDINLLTVLPASTAPGLQLLTRDGEWVEVDVAEGMMIVDTGDIMQYLTGGRVPATTHRVVNPPGFAERSRFSMPFFLHPRPDFLVQPLAGEAVALPAGELLRRRLVEIGVVD